MVYRTILVIVYCFFSFCVSGKNSDINVAILKELDQCIKNRASFEKIKIDQIQDLHAQLSTLTFDLQRQFHLNALLFKEYQSYKYDSAYFYAVKMQMIANQLYDRNLIIESKMAIAFSCMSSGLFLEALDVVSSIDENRLSIKSKINLYSFLSTLYINLAIYSRLNPYHDLYIKKSLQYCQKSMDLAPHNSSDFIMGQIREIRLNENYPLLIKTIEQYLNDNQNIDSHDFAILTSTLGYAYQVQHDDTKAIQYFAKAAIMDIKTATKETSAIRQLADLFYVKGDINQAIIYAQIALDDANFYNAQLRKIEIMNVLPIIEAGRFTIIKRQNDKLQVYVTLISIISVIFLIMTIFFVKQKQKLHKARQLIVEQNANLQSINNKMKEIDRIKDKYIGFFFNANSIYLEKLETYQKLVVKKLKNRQFEELMRLTDSAELQNEKENMFVLFDEIFLKIFPDFISRYNLLFEEKDRVNLKSESKLSPEIRIFALIRLGIVDSEHIARFLKYSVHTINNYKTKVKNRSIVPNELFEQKIMEIDSIITENY